MVDPRTEIDFPFYQNQVLDMFGNPRDPGFEKSYLRVIDLSEFAESLAHVLDYEGNPWRHRIYGNDALRDPVKRAVGLIVSRGLSGELKTFDGCFNIRPMKSGRQTSMHAWGLAVDFNQATNPFINSEAIARGATLITDFSSEFIACFLESGFEWGGLWKSFKDAMHFQLPWTGDWTQSQAPLKPVPWVA